MAFKDLLVHVDDTEAGKMRMDYAVALATAHEAHLTGVAFAVTGITAHFAGPGVPPVIASTEFLDKAKEGAEAALARFTERAEQQGLNSETRLVEGLPASFPRLMALNARHADLSVMAQPETGTQASGEELLIEEVLFTSGRPALVVPYVGAEAKAPETVICAWDAGAEAARAFNDGMPLLSAAKRVVVMVGEPQDHEGEYGEEPGADIALHLARHGVHAEVEHMHGTDIDIGNMLLSRIADEGADLLVMGAYRHSRLRQLVFGGVTRTILEHMTVPVLMAH